ncbi:hypothetical protein SUNI508_03757 [Seiridium unicorne]|uniref:GH18 domain-containing protein n=1 Tax=Seiridium unicorne TaxID=138068 RepID=A0ABR2VBN8_9PEZI
MSIAASASYWYLKPFPIDEMADSLDYIVFMAYDLHGAWDYGNAYSQSGCTAGNCLFSHVNETEVKLALAMITKAGVNANKVMVGESSYGRSYRMAEAGCTSSSCTYLGAYDVSQATPGRCTNSAGYIANAEINEIISGNGDITTWHDDTTGSDFLVYNTTDWVAYMTDDTKAKRRTTWEGLNFGGTVDWAVDLQAFNEADVVGPTGGDYGNGTDDIVVYGSDIWGWENAEIDAPISATNLLNPSPLGQRVTLTAYTTITLISESDSRWIKTTTFVSTAFVVTEVSFQPFTVAESDTSSGTVITYTPVPRITPQPYSLAIEPGWTVTSGNGDTSTATGGSDNAGGIIGMTSAATISTSTQSGSNATFFITWMPTVSYSIPSDSTTTNYPAPTVLPSNDEEDDPTNTDDGDHCVGAGCGGSDGDDEDDTGGCTGVWCGQRVTITALSSGVAPKPTCMIGCATLPSCADGGSSCNEPCNIQQCPPSRMPTAKECTEIVSSTAVATSPITSWSTTTRTRCETKVDCDATGYTRTTTASGTQTVYVDTVTIELLTAWTDGYANSVFTSLEAYFSSWEQYDDQPVTITTTTTLAPVTSTVTVTASETASPSPYAECAFWDTAYYYIFEVYNIENWATDGGKGLHDNENGCGALSGWSWEEAHDG